jgi:heat shock protein HslJ
MGRLTALCLALALLLSACGDDGGDDVSAGGGGGGATEVTFDDLIGKSYVSTAVTGHELVDGTEVNLTFIDGRISALAGCNTQNGDASLDGDTLVVERLASTMMACEDPLMAQDEWLAGFLEGGPQVALDGAQLTLTAGDEVIELEEQQPAD